MSHQLLEGHYVDFQLREIENDVTMLKKEALDVLKIFDEYEKSVESKFAK